jgi:hypothetical protein
MEPEILKEIEQMGISLNKKIRVWEKYSDKMLKRIEELVGPFEKLSIEDLKSLLDITPISYVRFKLAGAILRKEEEAAKPFLEQFPENLRYKEYYKPGEFVTNDPHDHRYKKGV